MALADMQRSRTKESLGIKLSNSTASLQAVLLQLQGLHHVVPEACTGTRSHRNQEHIRPRVWCFGVGLACWHLLRLLSAS